MNDARSQDHEAPNVALARQVDAICRRFEADWRAGGRPAIGDYLGEVAEEGRPHCGPNRTPWCASCAIRRRRSRALRPALPRRPSPVRLRIPPRSTRRRP